MGQCQGCCLTSYSAQNSLSQKIDLVPKINSNEVIFVVVFCFALVHIRKLKPKGINRLPVMTQHVSDRVGVQNISVSVRRCGLVCTVGGKAWDALNTPHQTPCMVPPHLPLTVRVALSWSPPLWAPPFLLLYWWGTVKPSCLLRVLVSPRQHLGTLTNQSGLAQYSSSPDQSEWT